ncbi:MAG: hypothetical protein HRT35_28505 [Algicola sp.]|nr:hypothetical protein [Algicola sp.]
MNKKQLVLTAMMLCSFGAQADFDYAGKGLLKYPTGMEKEFSYGFTFKQGENGYSFKVGEQQMNTADVPAKYSIWLTLHKNENVFVQEFAKGYFQAFKWQLGEHSIELKKKVMESKRVKGDYVLIIDGEEFYFKGKSGQIDIMFNKTGIRAISTSGFVRDKSFSSN